MISLLVENQIAQVRKLEHGEFDEQHRSLIENARYDSAKKQLILTDERWKTQFLGAGEEKAVFLICDQENRVFALEVIDETSYRNGRFVGGKYFCETRAPGLTRVPLHEDALTCTTFTGKIKAREFVHGYEWARFQFNPRQQSWLDLLLTFWLRFWLLAKFKSYAARYKDVHERNIMFEIRSMRESGVPILCKNAAGKFLFARVGLQPIDVR